MCVTVALYSDYTEPLRQACFVRACVELSDKCFEKAGFGAGFFGTLACFASGLREIFYLFAMLCRVLPSLFVLRSGFNTPFAAIVFLSAVFNSSTE